MPPLEPMTDDEQSNLAELFWQSPDVQALNRTPEERTRMSTEERQALSDANSALAIQHYGSLEALERDYSLPMTQEQWDLLNALPDEPELEARAAQGASFQAASNRVRARHQAELLARRRNDAAYDESDYLADDSDQGKKRKRIVEIFHNQTTS